MRRLWRNLLILAAIPPALILFCPTSLTSGSSSLR
jgi:hypothetical protein